MKGFTLVELLVSLSILGVLLSLGVANYRDYARRQGVLSAAKLVEADLRLAQEMANSGEKPSAGCGTLDGYRFSINPGGTTYDILADCTSPDVVIKNDVALPANISMAAVVNPGSASINTFVFKILGHGTNLVAGTTVNISFTFIPDPTVQKSQVLVTAAGDVRASLALPSSAPN